jgi:DcmR-like sensory protein
MGAAAPIPFAGSQLHGRSRHVCAFFNSHDEEYRVLLPFIKDGFERGDRAVHVVDGARCADHVRRLEAAGIDSTAFRRTGQLELRSDAETYLRNGRFDTDRMIEEFEQLASGNATGAFPLKRIVCHMDWAGEDPAHLDALVEFESRVNDVWARHDDAVICVYDLSKFGGATVLDMVRTHPLVIIGGILQQNPFFVPPDEFLRERRAQRA